VSNVAIEMPAALAIGASRVPPGTATSANSIAGSGEEHHEVTLPANPARFLDDQGTMYVQIHATSAASNALLSMDSFRLHVQ